RVLADPELLRGDADEAAAVVEVARLGAVVLGDAEDLGDAPLLGSLEADVLLRDDRLARQHVLERHAHADEDRLAHFVDLAEIAHSRSPNATRLERRRPAARSTTASAPRSP